LAEAGTGPLTRRLALLALGDEVGLEAWDGLSDQESQWLKRTMTIDRSQLPVSLHVNMPDWLWEKLTDQLGQDRAVQFAYAMNQPAPLDVRVNHMKSDRRSAQAELALASVQAQFTPYAPHGLRILKKQSLQNLPLFSQGVVEVQDEASQLVAQIVGAKRGEMVVDFCAGAGGKTLALGMAMKNTGRLYAFDIAEKSLTQLKIRLALSGLSNVFPVLIAHERDAKIKRLAGKIDRVLVDAPCSGLGTLRRHPDMKWRQSLKTIAEFTSQQTAILNGAACLVKPGGRLIYATCSILREENESIAEQFLITHSDFELMPMRDVLAKQKIDLAMDDYLKLSPEWHETDGFFAAVFQRAS
jgi:16S rRNA (cytosine967-C5)-methyltransferase